MKQVFLGGLAVLALSGVAQAQQQVTDFGTFGRSHEPPESPQHVAVEIRFGRYVPNVDDEFNGTATPFRDVYGNDNRYLLGLEVDWQVLRIPKFGTLGPGFGVGFTKLNGHGFLVDGTRAGQTDTLAILPFYAVGVLRADVIARETPVPLVPYGKLGFGSALWWASSGQATARDDSGAPGRGLSYGYQFALGGMLLLDPFDPDAAVEIDADMGVNNSYLFLEWYVSNLDGFGGDRMQVGTNTWMLGLALEI